MAYVYIVKCADGTLYTGSAKDLEKRIKLHNTGKGAKYTAARRPVRLVYSEEMPSMSAALKAEYQIKKLNRSQKETIIREFKKGR